MCLEVLAIKGRLIRCREAGDANIAEKSMPYMWEPVAAVVISLGICR